MSEQKDDHITIKQFDNIASVLDLPRETLPTELDIERKKPVSALDIAVEGAPLTDEEWLIIAPLFPKGIAHHARDDRSYLDACLWRERAKNLKKGWWFVPAIYGPTSSNHGRFLRWCGLGYWTRLYDALIASEGLSDSRLSDFKGIVREAELRSKNSRARRE